MGIQVCLTLVCSGQCPSGGFKLRQQGRQVGTPQAGIKKAERTRRKAPPIPALPPIKVVATNTAQGKMQLALTSDRSHLVLSTGIFRQLAEK